MHAFTPRGPSALLHGLLIASAAAPCLAQADTRADAAARAWLGRDAGDLLLVLRVDGGVDVMEDEATGETAYRFVSRGPSKRSWVSVGTQMGVAMTPTAGSRGQAVAVAAPMDTGYYAYAPGDLRCDITFHADRGSRIARWEYRGGKCARDIEAPPR